MSTTYAQGRRAVPIELSTVFTEELHQLCAGPSGGGENPLSEALDNPFLQGRRLRREMEGTSHDTCRSGAARRTCRRSGCQNPVKKSTAKYCSVDCCAADPERKAQMRSQARRSRRSVVLPMVRQLSLDMSLPANHPEAVLVSCAHREDVPRGMSRLVG